MQQAEPGEHSAATLECKRRQGVEAAMGPLRICALVKRGAAPCPLSRQPTWTP